MLSNGDANEEFLNSLLGRSGHGPSTISLRGASSGGSEFGRERTQNEILDTDTTKVDITLRTQVGQAPLIMLSITLPETKAEGQENTSDRKSQKVFISFEIRLNGRVNVVQVSGLGENETNVENPGTSKFHKKLNRVVEVSEDLSVLVEYVVSQLRGTP